ncbi:elongator complex protein 5 [Epargyreus clarus]|uniref:elongator complex protein 5 n=1 Tax=Epargyreus clarus TaxID=520877 RepID=UPI003C2CBBA6
MALLKLKSASFILIEDDYNHNLLPLLMELVQDENKINMFCYEQPISLWLNVFKNKNVKFCDESRDDQFITKEKSVVIIDSINQMVISLGWIKCLKYLKKLQSAPTLSKLIVILHKDCLPPVSQLQTHLNHISNAIVTYESPTKIKVLIKKAGKIFKSEELLSYDHNASVLISRPILKPEVKEEVVEKVSPADLSTFKIEVDQLNQLAKHQLKLPYMSKINEGQGKVYYEPDAVDDWDDEDPDDDLDI